MALGKRRTDQDENEIDMTPMLDVVFIMLIFFIVTASFVNEVGLGVNRPPTTDQPPPNTENTNIVFRISESNEITLAGRRIDIRAVRANVERLHAEKPEASVVISSHPKPRRNYLSKFQIRLERLVCMTSHWLLMTKLQDRLKAPKETLDN
jgi:biopolymer transport protein ExbD